MVIALAIISAIMATASGNMATTTTAINVTVIMAVITVIDPATTATGFYTDSLACLATTAPTIILVPSTMIPHRVPTPEG